MRNSVRVRLEKLGPFRRPDIISQMKHGDYRIRTFLINSTTSFVYGVTGYETERVLDREGILGQLVRQGKRQLGIDLRVFWESLQRG